MNIYKQSLWIIQKRNLNVFAEFVSSIRRQVKENQEFRKNVQLLSDETTRLSESDTMKKAKEAMKTGAQSTSKVVETVGKVVEATLETPVIKTTGKVLYKTGETVVHVGQKVAEPILDTKAVKAVASGVKSVKKEILDNSSSAYYNEYKPKDIRDRERQDRIKENQDRILKLSKQAGLPISDPSRPMLPNADAGSSVVMHRSSKLANAWKSFTENSSVAQRYFALKRGMEESDHPWLESWREWRARRRFTETEEAKVIRAIRSVDPGFRKDVFLKEMTQYTIPDVIESVLKEDLINLKDWCSERAYAKLSTSFAATKSSGLRADSKLLDLRRVDIRDFKLIEDELPVILISCSTHEILLYRNKKGEVALGKEDVIQSANYVIAFTKIQVMDPEAPIDPKTNGWVIVDWNRGGAW